MTKKLPEGPAGQALALAIAVLGVALVYFAVIFPILQFYDDRAEALDRRVTMAERYKVLARELPALRAADKNWRDRSGGELLLDGASDAIAAAALQAALKGVVEEAGAKLSSSEVLQPSSEGNFRRVGIRMIFSGDIKLVTAVLHGVEVSRPILSVGDFSLHAGSAAASVGESDDSGDESAAGGGDTLAVTVDVYGFRAG